jgi:1,4-alpha-glucan branching enzyme
MNDYQALLDGTHHDPFRFLGLHSAEDGGYILRIWAPDCRIVRLLRGNNTKLTLLEEQPHLFCCKVDQFLSPTDLQIEFVNRAGATWLSHSPYTFQPVLGELDLHLISEGQHQQLWKALGAKCITHQGIKGTHFAVWAPGAKRVSVVGGFNNWNGLRHSCRCLGSNGVWEIFIPAVADGDVYKYEILTQNGKLIQKADPLARQAALRPDNTTLVCEDSDFIWSDQNWISERFRSDPLKKPLSIYELHPGSWKRSWSGEPAFMNWRDIAVHLVEHIVELGFTHVELMPVMEHPLDASWGYQVSGYFAPTARHGTPDDFRFFINHLHENEIGVILDWVPGHFPKDDHALATFDGSCLYEHEDPRQGEHPDWGTLVFNFGRNEVRNFLIANALYWIEEFHIDGLRIDAVASMLYLDYSRKAGEWVPNIHGGRENLEAISFMRELNQKLFAKYPGILSIAEESTSWPMVSRPIYLGGLGFNLKWNMGWMNDTLRYFEQDPVHRSYHHDLMSFSLVYAWQENFILVLSHDEVVHGKKSLLKKMPGDRWQQFANLRLLYAWMWCHPGRKLLFMGGEMAQSAEWQETQEIDWSALSDSAHFGVNRLLADLNKLMMREAALYQIDFDNKGFEWINANDPENSVFSFVRKSIEASENLVVVANCTPVPRQVYNIGVPAAGIWQEILNTDAECYGGSNLGNNGEVHSEKAWYDGYPDRVTLVLPPLALIILKLKNPV